MEAPNLADAFLDALESLVMWFVSLIPSGPLPAWFDSSAVVNAADTLLTWAGPATAWFPLGLFASALVGTLSLWGVMVLIRIAMKVYAMIRGGAS